MDGWVEKQVVAVRGSNQLIIKFLTSIIIKYINKNIV